MKRIQLVIITLVCCIGIVCTRNITLDFPANSGRNITLALKQGIGVDTIYRGTLDAKGHALITIPPAYKEYKGIAELRPERPGAYFEFIVAGEDMTLHCEEEYPYGGNVTFSGSPENQWLQSRFFSQNVRLQKMELLSQAVSLYDSGSEIYRTIESEIASLKARQTAFEDSLSQSRLYAARFIGLRNLLADRIAPLVFMDSLQMAGVRDFVRDSLDINSLYTSGMWYDTLNGLLALYDNQAPYHASFIGDMSLLLQRTGSQRIYNTLAENLFSICESTGWNDLEEQLAYFLINDGRIEAPEGKLSMLMSLFKLAKGSKIPALTQGELPRGKVLLVFYESGCGPCENEMMMLKANYPLIREKGYEVVSVSADSDADVFKNTASVYPWKDKYCDLQSFDGEDFRNFGVIGTPTFYVIEEGIVKGRYARLQDTDVLEPAIKGRK